MQGAVTRIQKHIEEHRKGWAVLHIKRADGAPLKGVEVSAQQCDHDFRFGCHLDGFDRFKTAEENETYKQFFARLFNAAVIRFYHPVPYACIDKAAAWCLANGVKMRGQLVEVYTEEQIKTVASRYRDSISQWEIVTNQSSAEFIKRGYQWLYEADAGATRIFRLRGGMTDEQYNDNMLRELGVGEQTRDRAPINGIGLSLSGPSGIQYAPAKILRVLEQYAKTGLPLQIDQLMLPADSALIHNSWEQGVWTEREQADYAAILYTVCFSHPNVEAINWGAFSDAEISGGYGLLRAKLHSRRAYKILRKLIHSEWQTRIHGATDEKGDFQFRGFYGRYRITVIPPSNVAYTTFIHLTMSGTRHFDIRLNA